MFFSTLRSNDLLFEREKAVKNLEELDNCGPVLLCTSTDMETIWTLCGAYSSIFLDTDSVEEKGKKRHLDFV